MSRYAVLIGRIKGDLEDLEQLVHKNSILMDKIDRTKDMDYLGTVALNLHSFYCVTERICQDVALEIDNSLPEGSDWHRRLLRQMSADIPDLRPKLFGKGTFKALNELCAFRHVVRNVYTFDLIPSRIQDLASTLPDCLEQLRIDLRDFCDFLAILSQD
ncbi:hypothetical protein [Gloeocapsa sp. PCC 73106]|uniref:ribonuclease toxin HepT-like protein n=1 Tax=Gloeocapsa sp. PCC 73106 TaxID=102232 RepID=UPI0002ABC0E1|nr:hypothetical protein [Gloeocapsa sp. PCC 73106]ELS00006.1 hypothetical protein GLO73106DRAFT_00038590 [Gloeocapsa sp. PCC 73106]